MSKSKYDSSQTHLFTSFPESHQDSEMEELINESPDQSGNLETESPDQVQETKYSLWQVEYYQKYFNVDTSEVLSKIVGSITPSFNQSFFQNKIRPNPDLYGPFWIAITLVFTIAISGNFVSFLQNFGSDYQWHTDFHKVTTSAFAIISYWWIVPTILYTILRWRQNDQVEFSFIELLSIYGYSLFVYIPISILWLINISAIQWLLVLFAIGSSGSVLFFTLWPSLSKDSSKQIAFGVMVLVILLHALLGLSFMLYFFHSPADKLNPTPGTTTTTLKSIAERAAANLTANI